MRILSAGWSSLAARRAHNPKVVGSNPTPATKWNELGNLLICPGAERISGLVV